MSNSLKNSKKTAKQNPEKLVEEIEEEVSWNKISKDERTHKIFGTIFLLIGLFLFISFTSYLFTWNIDQSSVIQNGWHFLFMDDVKAANVFGRLGALVAHFFFYNCFGIASYLICTFFFIIGVNLLFERKYFSIAKNLKFVLIGLTIASILFSFLCRNNTFFWGGAFGDLISGWLIRFAGVIGASIILLTIAIAYIIWRFNPKFNFGSIKNIFNEDEYEKPNVAVVENSLDYETAKMQEEDNNAAQKELAANFAARGNMLKNENGVVVLSPSDEEADSDIALIVKNAYDDKGIHVTMPQQTILQINETTDENITFNNLHTNANNLEIPIAPKKEKPFTDNVALEINTNPIETTLEQEAEAEAVLELTTSKSNVFNPYEPTLDLSDYKYPHIDMLESHGSEKIVQDPTELETNKNQIISTLRNYDIEIQKIMATVGPTVTLYEIVPAPGVRISRIKNLEDDIALSLAALGIRIIAPIPGKGTIGIEVPNLKKTIVSMRSLLSSEKFQNNSFSLPIALGKKIDNENFIVDLATMPHLLMAGATGQGKSVGLNAVLVSLLYKKHPSQLKLVLVDPKKVELSLYRHIEKHFLAKLPGEEESIITDTKKVVHTLNALCIEMDNRYDLLKEAGCRNIKEYNEKFVGRKLNPEKGHQYLPFIVLVIDEFADLIMTAGKEVEMPIARLAQLARAIGIHLIIATQRPSVNIITGTIKANFPARIAFKVSSKIDSRTILDTGGAEQLIGKGDMLVSYNGEVTRLQCAFVDTPEVDKVVAFISEQRGYPDAFMLPEYVDENDGSGKNFSMDEKDSLFDDAAKLIVMSQSGSTSLIQRKLKLGYNRAGRVMDQLEAAGIVGPAQGSKPRDVYIKTDADLMEHLSQLG